MHVATIDPREGPSGEVDRPAYRVHVWEPRDDADVWGETSYRLTGEDLDVASVLAWGRDRSDAVGPRARLVIWVETTDALVRLSGEEPTGVVSDPRSAGR